MKNINKLVVLVLVIIIIGAVAWRFNSSKDTARNSDDSNTAVPTSQTVVVSTKISEYKNDELGFSVKYPTVWEKAESANGVLFTAPIDGIKEKNTIGKLSSKIDVVSGKCAFPPVTTVKERDTVKVGDLSFNMISIANTVQSRNYFDRMFSLQKDSICYFFTFSAITSSPASKGMTAEDAKIASANNTKLVDEADTQFKDMVKSFKIVVGPEGQDETKAPKN
jgi:type II secretory pathway pseudopilin PulG